MPFNDIQSLELGPLYGFIVDTLTKPDPVGGDDYPPKSYPLSSYPVAAQPYVITELGLSEGGCTLTLDVEQAEKAADQYGTNVLDYTKIKTQASITYPMAEDLWEVLSQIMSDVVYDSADDYMAIGIGVGTSLRDFLTSGGKKRGFLGVKVVGGQISTSPHDQIFIPLAGLTSGWELSYSKDTQRVREITITGVFDPNYDPLIFGDYAKYLTDKGF